MANAVSARVGVSWVLVCQPRAARQCFAWEVDHGWYSWVGTEATEADRFAANVLPIIREAQKAELLPV